MLGATTPGYDPTRDAISRLAAVGASSRPAMTAGMAALAAGMGLYAAAVGPGPVRRLAAANGALTLGVAAVPLGWRFDAAHGTLAALGYATLAAIPVTAGMVTPTGWQRRGVALATGVTAAACLAATTFTARDGILQRAGLTVAQLWIVASALGLYSSSYRPPRCLDKKRSAAA